MIVFLLAVYGLPVAFGLWALWAGFRSNISSWSFAAVIVPLLALVGTFAYVYRDDGWTDYSRYLGTCGLVAAAGLLAASVRERRERIASRRSSRTLHC